MVKEYTIEDARRIMKKLSIILGLGPENIPEDKEVFYELFISEVLNIYGEEKVFSQINKATKKTVSFDLRVFNKPISIVWFVELCEASYNGMTAYDYAMM